EEKAAMRKIMKDATTDVTGQANKTAEYPEFTSNKQLVPKKDIARINAIPKKKLLPADMSSYAGNLYNKILTKGNAAEMAIVKKVIAQSTKASDLGGAAILSMMQGHPQAALALSMKAVQADPASANWQNNMASLLTQYGYPEQALPVLQKLRNDFPDNSTIMNNLAHAWLGLGEIDSAKNNIRIATRLNPYHPETKQTEGVIEETTGNPVKAAEDYTEAMENSVDPFTEKLVKNNNGQSASAKANFEKLKRCITVYEYFPKDWIKIPALADNVSAFESNIKIKNGYTKMFEELTAKIEALTEASNAEVDALMEKGETEFAKTMMKESMKGLSMMSKPAVIVQIALATYLAKWAEDYQKESSAMLEMINKKHMEMTKIGDNDKCPDHDRKNNAFLEFANPIIRKFYAEKIEESREWLNIFCTWTWYIAGNPKNTVMTQCITWTAFIKDICYHAIEEQYAIEKSCVSQNSTAATYIAPPEIPNFSCPSVLSIPTGNDWQELSKSSQNFDDNKYAIKKATENPVPNHTTAYGADHTSIAEPGPDPFFKSANGSMTPGITEPELSAGAKLVQILKKYNERRSIDFKLGITSPDGAAESVADDILKVLEEARNKEAQEQAQSDWFREYQKKKIEKYKAEEQRLTDWFKDILKMKIAYAKSEEYKREIEKAMEEQIRKRQKSKLAQELLKKMMSTDCKNVKSTKQIQKELFEKGMREAGDNIEDLRENGLQPSLSSGLQAPGTFTPVKGLFN
ncbi:MAG: hypothetical protein WBB06_13490, partial [Chitinophagaceae bacterium]